MILTPASRVGLCLSGGGFRATFFHLGLIKLLWDAQLLGTIKNVWSVSGGSILAANLALAWKEYLKSSEEAAFYRSCLPLFQLAQGNLRGRILRKWAAGRAFSRSNSLVNLLQTNYSQFVAGAELGQFYNTGVAFQLLATSMTTGRLVSFGHAGYNDGERLHPAQHLPVAMAIAASSAFPVMFAPVAVTTDLLNAAAQEFPAEKRAAHRRRRLRQSRCNRSARCRHRQPVRRRVRRAHRQRSHRCRSIGHPARSSPG